VIIDPRRVSHFAKLMTDFVARAAHRIEHVPQRLAQEGLRVQPPRVELGELGKLGAELLEQLGPGAVARRFDVAHDPRGVSHGARQLFRAEQRQRESGENDELERG
jgi:hypothetical protein